MSDVKLLITIFVRIRDLEVLLCRKQQFQCPSLASPTIQDLNLISRHAKSSKREYREVLNAKKSEKFRFHAFQKKKKKLFTQMTMASMSVCIQRCFSKAPPNFQLCFRRKNIPRNMRKFKTYIHI